MLGLKLNHVSKRGPWMMLTWSLAWNISEIWIEIKILSATMVAMLAEVCHKGTAKNTTDQTYNFRCLLCVTLH